MGMAKRRVFGILCLAMFAVTAYFVVDAVAFPEPGKLTKLPAAAYFTIQSNILVGVWFALIGLKELGVKTPRMDGAVNMMLTVYISVTGLVYWAVLVPMLGANPSMFSASNIWTHTVAPLYSLAIFFFILRGKSYGIGRAMLVVIYPLCYMAFSYLLLALTGHYTYPFLNPEKVGGWGVAVSIIGVAALVISLALLYRRRWNRRSGEGIDAGIGRADAVDVNFS